MGKINVLIRSFLKIIRNAFDYYGPLIGPKKQNLERVTDVTAGSFGLRIYKPHSQEKVPVLLFYHGGAWVLGSIKAYDHICQYLSAKAGYVVVSVEYRLLPEYPFRFCRIYLSQVKSVRFLAKEDAMLLKISKELLPKFKYLCSSPEVIMLFVYMKCRFSLSYRDLEEMMQIRGAVIDHSTLQRWVRRFARLISDRVREWKRPVNGSWRMDETYIKLNGKWIYLYRAVDKESSTIDFLLRARRDAAAAKAFFRKAIKSNGRPEKVTVDKSGSNKAALGYCNQGLKKNEKIEIRQIKYLNNIIEQDHRFIKKRTRPTLGFKSFNSARETIAGIESVRMIQKGQITGQTKNSSSYQNFANLMAA